jgi:protein-disulfide isomerase
MRCKSVFLIVVSGLGLLAASHFYSEAKTQPCCQSEVKEKRPKDETIAVINGRQISQAEIDAPMASQIQSLEQKIYEMRSKSLEALIGRILLEEEAARKGASLEDLRRQIVSAVKVGEKEIEDAYRDNLSRYGPPPMGEIEAKERIRSAIESQKRSEALNKAIDELKTRSKIEMFLKAPEPLRIEISKQGPSLGAESAPVTVAAFVDFQCQYCKKVNDTLKQVVQSYGNNVRVIHKNLPLPNHPQSFKAAQAAFCAGEQGKFWPYHDLLFEHANDLSEKALTESAAEAGVNLKEFNTCLDSEASKNAVMKDLQEARQAGIFSTPTFVINGRALKGARSLEDFKAIIDQSLKEPKAQKKVSIK